MAAIIIEKQKNESYISYLQMEFAHDRAISTVVTAQSKTWPLTQATIYCEKK